MGVMECSRYGCTYILCDTYVSEVGYVCNGCQYSFKGFIENKFRGLDQTEEILLQELINFMQEDRQELPEQDQGAITVEEFFKQYQ